MIPFLNSYDNWFDWEENYWDLNILFEKQFIKHSRPFAGISKDYSCWYCYLWWWTEQFLEQIVQISVLFISNKSKLIKIKEWYHVSLTFKLLHSTWLFYFLIMFFMTLMISTFYMTSYMTSSMTLRFNCFICFNFNKHLLTNQADQPTTVMLWS